MIPTFWTNNEQSIFFVAPSLEDRAQATSLFSVYVNKRGENDFQSLLWVRDSLPSTKLRHAAERAT